MAIDQMLRGAGRAWANRQERTSPPCTAAATNTRHVQACMQGALYSCCLAGGQRVANIQHRAAGNGGT